jgi:DNA polymerase III epsilon subunit-like protein
VIVGHNSKLFDRKFLNARLIKAGERPKNSQFHFDTMWTIRTHLRTSSKLDNIQKFLNLPDEKTPISWDDWMRAGAFDGSAMDQVVKHCEQDVRVLEQAYWKLLPYQRTLRRD